MKRKVVYTDAPPDVREAIDYAVEHNLFLTREQFFNLLENSKQETIFTDAPPEIEVAFARSKRVKDFLPPPNELVRRSSNKAVAIA